MILLRYNARNLKIPRLGPEEPNLMWECGKVKRKHVLLRGVARGAVGWVAQSPWPAEPTEDQSGSQQRPQLRGMAQLARSNTVAMVAMTSSMTCGGFGKWNMAGSEGNSAPAAHNRPNASAATRRPGRRRVSSRLLPLRIRATHPHVLWVVFLCHLNFQGCWPGHHDLYGDHWP